jgi:hypothetical protein
VLIDSLKTRGKSQAVLYFSLRPPERAKSSSDLLTDTEIVRQEEVCREFSGEADHADIFKVHRTRFEISLDFNTFDIRDIVMKTFRNSFQILS